MTSFMGAITVCVCVCVIYAFVYMNHLFSVLSRFLIELKRSAVQTTKAFRFSYTHFIISL